MSVRCKICEKYIVIGEKDYDKIKELVAGDERNQICYKCEKEIALRYLANHGVF